MGITYADLRLGNDAREDLEEIDANAVVDTGALHLCIPEHLAIQLQLKTRSQREVQTADGKSHLVDYVSPVRISMLGRECVTGALVIGNQYLNKASKQNRTPRSVPTLTQLIRSIEYDTINI